MPERAQRLVFAGFCALFSCPDGRVWEWGGWKWPDGLVGSKGDGWLSAALCRPKMAFLKLVIRLVMQLVMQLVIQLVIHFTAFSRTQKAAF